MKKSVERASSIIISGCGTLPHVLSVKWRDAASTNGFADELLEEAQEKLESWRQEYNQERLHRSLNDLTPEEYLASWWHKQQLGKDAAPAGQVITNWQA